ncbi:hypothetical protein MHY87_00520 [Microvirga sp. ACRRW]|uniref:hypothetical protein n=1 Tax=Microvirga sp. ACRRW TaxID=2918205 RepID=UPI001EF6BD9A|nr:hypothetical protein [Microvirga sp. ACRRW]MCG7391389.1 hypothetical protein [Microvirga sp. ACRRW]
MGFSLDKGTNAHRDGWHIVNASSGETIMNNIIWLIGAIVVVLAILSFLGLR